MAQIHTVPTTGTHGSFQVGSDRYPCTVVAVSPSFRKATVQRDTYKVTLPDGGYEFTRDLNGEQLVFTLRKNGKYDRAGRQGQWLNLQGWDAYYDRDF